MFAKFTDQKESRKFAIFFELTVDPKQLEKIRPGDTPSVASYLIFCFLSDYGHS